MKKISFLCVLTIISFIISFSVILLNHFISEAIFLLDMLQLFCVIVSFLCLFISLLEFYCGLFKIRIDSDSIKFYKGKRNYMNVNYCDIKYLSLLEATDYYWSPILDSDKKKCVAMSAYLSEEALLANFSANSVVRMQRANYKKSNSDSDVIFRCVYNKEDFIEIFKHTKAKIYICEELFELYIEDFNVILKNTHNQIFVSAFDENGEMHFRQINYTE